MKFKLIFLAVFLICLLEIGGQSTDKLSKYKKINKNAGKSVHHNHPVRHMRKSKAKQFFTTNCLLNVLMQREFELGLEYLNASIHLSHDSIALHGFSKMFKSYWHNQLENVNKIREYIILRGGIVDTPFYRNDPIKIINSHNHFFNETTMIHRFLELSKKSNSWVLEVHNATTRIGYELECHRIYDRILYENPIDEIVHDRHTSHFLDQDFTNQKINQIDFIANLYTRVSRFDRSEHGLGIHIIDNELKSIF